jgi:hypothetical protein
MLDSKMTFGELVATARSTGFELYDARQMPVDPELQMALEDKNLLAEPVHVRIHEPPDGLGRGIVADLQVRGETFHLWGEWVRVWDLEQIVRGAAATPGAVPLGRPPKQA